MLHGSEESATEATGECEPLELGASDGSHAPLQFTDVQPTSASQNNSARSVRSLKHTFDRTRNNDIQIITPELCDWVQQCSEAVAELASSTATAAAAASASASAERVKQGSEAAEARQDDVTKPSTDAHQRRHSRTGSCGNGPEAEANKAEARLASCVIHIVKVFNDAACAVEVDTSVAVMTDCIFMLNDVVCVSEQSKVWEEQLPTLQQPPQTQREEQTAQRPASSGSNCSSSRRRKSTINDRLRNLWHALDGLQHRLEVLLLAIVRHRTIGVCRLRLDARTYRVGVNDSYVASSLPESLEVNVLRPLGEGLRSVLPMVASKLLSMALNEALNGVLDFLLEQRIMFNFSGVHRLYKDMEAIKGWVVRLKQLWACPPGQELLEDKSGWVRVNKVLMVLAGEEQTAPSGAVSGNSNRNTEECEERNQWQTLRRSSWVESVRFWKSSSFRARRNAGIVPSIQLDFSEL